MHSSLLAVILAAAAANAPAPAKATYDKLQRLDFNRRAAERYLNVFWRSDANQNNALDPDELAFLWGYGDLKPGDLIDAKGFTPAFAKLYDELVSADGKAATPDEQARRDTIKEE